MKKVVWVFGNAVQDVTVSVNLDTFTHGESDAFDDLRLEETPIARKGLILTTQMGTTEFGVELKLDEGALDQAQIKKTVLPDGEYAFHPGQKYPLLGKIEELADKPRWRRKGFAVPCEDILWGGGGINVCRFLRALAPSNQDLPLRYTDYAMSRRLHIMLQQFENEIRNAFPRRSGAALRWGRARHRVARLMKTDPRRAELLTHNLAGIFARFSPGHSLEVFLASLGVESALFRPADPSFRRNWVISGFTSPGKTVTDKIIFRGKTPSETKLKVRAAQLEAFVDDQHGEVGAIVLNSLKDKLLFKAAYRLLTKKLETDPKFLGVLAMTESMQQFLPWMIGEAERNHKPKRNPNDPPHPHFPGFILVFNDSEAVSFARALGGRVPPLLRGEGDLPNVKHFAKFIEVVRSRFWPQTPRIYVTVGSRGSLGFEPFTNSIIHVSYYSRRDDTLFDTNACGDAYCAAVTLLEWTARNVDQSPTPVQEGMAEEMQYFMAVATASAYCKARNRRGRLDSETVGELLRESYLGVGVAGILGVGNWEDWVEEDGRARRPPVGTFRGVSTPLKAFFEGRLSEEED
ncbi:MAG: hypothetical protein ACE5GX_08625 [Thermoanaerobaculia bacterium]